MRDSVKTRKKFDSKLLMKVINYSLRSSILLIGVICLLGLVEFQNMDPVMLRVFGVITILFGAYRLSIYHMIMRRQAMEERFAEMAKERENLDK